MKAYRAFDGSEIEAFGEMEFDQIFELIEESIGSLGGGREFGIGIFRSEKDVLEIRPVGNDIFLIGSDYIALPFWKKLFSKNHMSPIVSGMGAVKNVIRSYTEKSRIECEKEYC